MPRDKQQLRRQRLREVNFQGDTLRTGMDWTDEDLGKPQVPVDSAYGMGHPGTFHIRRPIEEEAAWWAGTSPASSLTWKDGGASAWLSPPVPGWGGNEHVDLQLRIRS